MNIRWLGHACFMMTTEQGTRILVDPYDASVGYAVRPQEADVMTISHQHHDHNYRDMATNNPVVLEAPGQYNVGGLSMEAIASFHDDVHGAKRGTNLIFTYLADGLRVCHLGDLGHQPDDEMLHHIGAVDVLMLPVGGVYTLDPEEACALVRRMRPRVVLPMHYRTQALSFSLATAQDFLACMDLPDMPPLSTLDVNATNINLLPPVLLLDWQG